MKRLNRQDRGDTDIPGRNGPKEAHRVVDFSILILPGVHTSALYGAHDILSSAGTCWDGRRRIASCHSSLRIRTVGLSTAPLEGWNGVPVQPVAALADVARTDVVYIPALGPPDGSVPPTDPAVCRWLGQQYRNGAIIATACSGSFVLAEAGLLDEQPATTHWAYAGTFTERFPNTRLCAERALVLAGDEQRIVTAGGGSLWSELLLYLIARLMGREAAVHIAKLYLMDWGRDDQSPYAAFQERLQHADAQIRKAQQWIADHVADVDVLARARLESGLQERTFERRFKLVTGVSPGRYVQEIRIELAKEAIAMEYRPIDDIASDVGYLDPSTFRRLFKRMVGISPSAYRRRMAPPA